MQNSIMLNSSMRFVNRKNENERLDRLVGREQHQVDVLCETSARKSV